MDSATTVNEVKETLWLRIQSYVLSKEGKFILLCVIAAFLVRIFLIRYQYVIHPDGVYYAVLGKRFISGDIAGGMSAYWPPLYPLLIGISSLFFSDLEFAGRFVSVLAGTLLMIPSYLLIREFYGRTPAYLGAILIVVYPALTECSTFVLTESLYALLFTIGVLVGWWALRGLKSRTYFFTGILFGACYLVKPEAIGYIFLMFMLTLSAKIFHKHLRFRTVTQNALILISGFLILSLPYFIYLRKETGNWTISQKLVFNLTTPASGKSYLHLTEDKDATMWDKMYGDAYYKEVQQSNTEARQTTTAPAPTVSTPRAYPNLKGIILKTPGALKIILKEIFPQMFPYLLIFLSILGIFRKSWTKDRAIKETYLFLFVVSTLIGYALTVVELRYLVPLLPILIGLAAKGVVEFEGWFLRSASSLGIKLYERRALIRAVFLTILVLSLIREITYPMRVNKWLNLPYEHKQAGLWLKEHSGPSPLVMSSMPHTSFYADARHLFIPIREDYKTILEYARRKKVDYLTIEQRCFDKLPCIKDSSLAFLLDERNAPSELKLVYKNDENLDYKILVYELKDQP